MDHQKGGEKGEGVVRFKSMLVLQGLLHSFFAK